MIRVANMIVSYNARDDLANYSPGTCLGIMLCDPQHRRGGLLHVMPPDSSIDPVKVPVHPHMFVGTGLPRLFHAIYNLGATRSQLGVKIAGWAQFIGAHTIFNIGQRDHHAIPSLLDRNGFSVHAADIGGAACRTLRLSLTSGVVIIQSLDTPAYPL